MEEVEVDNEEEGQTQEGKNPSAFRIAKQIKKLLDDLGFPSRFNTEQTSLCVSALADNSPREGLILGKKTLREGARIHNIIQFSRTSLGKTIAENTRESLRKTSLKYLVDFGL